MNIDMLTAFFMWCTIISAGVYLFWVLLVLLAPDFVYRVQSRWIPVPREAYNIIIYSFMGLFKIVFILFAVVPYVSLLIIG